MMAGQDLRRFVSPTGVSRPNAAWCKQAGLAFKSDCETGPGKQMLHLQRPAEWVTLEPVDAGSCSRLQQTGRRVDIRLRYSFGIRDHAAGDSH